MEESKTETSERPNEGIVSYHSLKGGQIGYGRLGLKWLPEIMKK